MSTAHGYFRSPRSPTKTTNAQHIEAETPYATAPDPGSPTDDDEEYVTPQSPILSSMSAQRRVQASSRFCSDGKARKRRYDGSGTTGSSPKLTKKYKDIQPLDWSLPTEAPESGKTSFNISFGVMSSVQQTQPNTGMTSFTSETYGGDVIYPDLAQKSSTSTRSLDDAGLKHINSRLNGEFSSFRDKNKHNHELRARRSSSNFGSVDEEDLLNAPALTEIESAGTGTRTTMAPPQRPHERPTYGIYPWRKEPAGHEASKDPLESNDEPINPTGHILQETSKQKSSSFTPWYIRDLPTHDLFVEQLPKKLERFPFFLLFICCRISIESKIPMIDLMDKMHPGHTQRDPAVFWERINSKITNPTVHDSDKVWSAAKKDFEGFVFKGNITVNEKRFRGNTTVNTKGKGDVFRLEILPIQADRSCRFERKFGAHRFLHLNMTSFDSWPGKFNKQQWDEIQTQWEIWLHQEHSFLGRKWSVFHVEPVRKSKDGYDKKLVLFATEGVGIDEPISIGAMLNWFLPFKANKDQSFCKVYARYDLGLSRTIPTLSFKPSQVRYVSDIWADNTPENATFNDGPLFTGCQKSDTRVVMNDGCAQISVGAALEVWKKKCKATDSKEPLPSALQGRIGGAKGLWTVCGEPSTTDPSELAIWIEVTESQQKFQPHDEDLRDDLNYDIHRLTFDYVNHSSRPSPAPLHISFIPILADRGVPQNDIAKLAKACLDAERQKLLETLLEPVKLYHWLHQYAGSGNGEDLSWDAGLPRSMSSRIGCLLQSGFYPANEPFLAGLLCRFIKTKQTEMEEKLKIPLGKATNLYGVADPLGVLAPGEVHVEFSEPFLDEATGTTFRALNNLDLLVSRQPACRRSDIQRVRAVKKPELSHLVDVVVFPSRGEYPMAGKLQGGDYDGDIFWLSWDPALVKPFKNAPAPLISPEPKNYGIRKDSRKLHQVMDIDDLSTVDQFKKEALKFRLSPSLLGLVTNFLEKQAYKENRIYSSRLNALCDVHDLLVDAPKQGYLFDKLEYTKLVERKLRCGNPKVPSYKQVMDDCAKVQGADDADKLSLKDYKHKPDNVLDSLYFDVLRRHNAATLTQVKETFPKEDCDDAALRYPYKYLLSLDNDEIKAEMRSLTAKLVKLGKEWGANFAGKIRPTAEILEACYSQYLSLGPSSPIIEPFQPLMQPYLSESFQLWKYIRASALYTAFPTLKRINFVWQMCGRELMAIKSGTIPGSMTITPTMLANMKPKPIKTPKPKADEEDEEEQKEKESQPDLYPTLYF